MKLSFTAYTHLKLDPEEVVIRKQEGKRVQLMFRELGRTTFSMDTDELLRYLEYLAEEVRQIHNEQYPTTL